jgi:hypothetical protein
MTRSAWLVLVLVGSLGIAACGGDDEHHGGDEGAPAAPTDLTVEELDGAAHLTWVDNSDNETQFMVMRMNVDEGGDYAAIASPPFDTIQYHDATGLVSGDTYMYMVHAMNDEGTSDPSNEVEWTAP